MATVAAPIDATSTAAWKALEAHQEKLEAEGIDLKAWFAADAERVNKLSFDAGDLHFDLSKNLVTDETVKLLCDLAREVKLEERRDAMFSGEHINTTEDRAVLHTALRRPASEKGQLIVDGQDVVADVHEVLDRMYAFAERVRSGEWKGVTGKRIEHLVSIGIGGSDLGPVMAYRLPLYLQHRSQRPGREAQGSGSRDHARDHRLQDLHHARDPHQRPRGQDLDARAAQGSGRHRWLR